MKSLFLREFVLEAELEGRGGFRGGTLGIVPDDEGVVVGVWKEAADEFAGFPGALLEQDRPFTRRRKTDIDVVARRPSTSRKAKCPRVPS